MNLLALAALLATAASAPLPPVLQVPVGGPQAIIVDGVIEAREWNDAARLEIGDGISLLARQHADAIYLALQGPDSIPRIVELFVRTERGKLLQLHASMLVGERDLTVYGKPTDDLPWQWHVHPSWNANRANLDPSKSRDLEWSQRLLRRDGVEFQVLREKFEGEAIAMRIHVSAFPGVEGETVFPANSDFTDTGNWLRVNLKAAG